MMLATAPPPTSLLGHPNSMQANNVSEHDDLTQRVADRLRFVRKVLLGGATQQDAAERAGVRLSNLKKWEAGINPPTAANIVRLAEGWDVSADYLLCLSDLPPGSPGQIAVVDLDRFDAIMAATSERDLDRLQLGKSFGILAALPTRCVVESAADYAERLRKCEEHVRGLLGKR